MELPLDPLVDPFGHHAIDIAGTRAEPEAVEGVLGTLAVGEFVERAGGDEQNERGHRDNRLFHGSLDVIRVTSFTR